MATALKNVTPEPSTVQGRKEDLQAMLQARQAELRQLLHARVREESAGGGGSGLDETEQAEADVQQHIEVALIQMKGNMLQRIEEALGRLNSGEYGYCVDCEGEISERRLLALPLAARCTACESEFERRQTLEGRGVPAHGFLSFFQGQAGS